MNVNFRISETLRMLRLNRVNHCVLLPVNDNYKGMIQKVKDYVTWGETDPDTLARMILHRGRLIGDKKISDKYIKENTNYSSILAFA